MSDQLSAGRSFVVETGVAVFVDRRYASTDVRQLDRLIRSHHLENHTRFNTEAAKVFKSIRKHQKRYDHLPAELLDAPYGEALSTFQRMLWSVVGVFADHPGNAKKKLIERYGSGAFRKGDAPEQESVKPMTRSSQMSDDAGLATT